jgi:hypothetical protein
LAEVIKGYPGLQHIIWVVKEGSRHMDWNEVPEGFGGKVEVGVWHDIVEEKKGAIGSALPDNAVGEPQQGLVTIWQFERDDVGIVTEYTQKVRLNIRDYSTTG